MFQIITPPPPIKTTLNGYPAIIGLVADCPLEKKHGPCFSECEEDSGNSVAHNIKAITKETSHSRLLIIVVCQKYYQFLNSCLIL